MPNKSLRRYVQSEARPDGWIPLAAGGRAHASYAASPPPRGGGRAMAPACVTRHALPCAPRACAGPWRDCRPLSSVACAQAGRGEVEPKNADLSVLERPGRKEESPDSPMENAQMRRAPPETAERNSAAEFSPKTAEVAQQVGDEAAVRTDVCIGARMDSIFLHRARPRRGQRPPEQHVALEASPRGSALTGSLGWRTPARLAPLPGWARPGGSACCSALGVVVCMRVHARGTYKPLRGCPRQMHLWCTIPAPASSYSERVIHMPVPGSSPARRPPPNQAAALPCGAARTCTFVAG